MTVTVETATGTIVEVSTSTLGDELAVDHAAGATVLSVKDAYQFADAGGWLTIGAETIYYTSSEDDEEADVGLVTLSTPLASAYTEGTRVTLDPPSFEKTAQVMIGDFGEAQEADILHDLWEKIPDRIWADGEGPVVDLVLRNDRWTVTNVVGSEPLIDGSYLDPDVPLPPELAVSGPPGLVWRGTWDPATFYDVTDGVMYNGSSYIRLVEGTTATSPDVDNTDVDPAANWDLFAAQGDTGTPGDPGASAYEQWLAAGNTGTEADFLASLEGPEGPPGPVSDGSVPASSPAATVVSNAVGQLQVSWPAVANADPVTYKVYLSTTTPVPIGSSTLLTTTTALTVATMVGAGGGALASNVRYYAVVRASDADGDATAVGAEDSAVVKGRTDGLAPLGSPAPTVYGAFGALAVTFTPLTITAGAARTTTVNPDPVVYDVHLSTTSTVAGDSTTQVGKAVAGSPVFIRAQSNGTALTAGTNYWVALRARDDDGSGPLSTVFGPVQTAAASGGDVVLTANMMIANHVLAAAIEAEDLTGTTITGATLRTAASGRRAEVRSTPDNLVAFYSGSVSEQRYGSVEADVLGNLARLLINAPDTDTAGATSYRNMILMAEDVTDVTPTRNSRSITARTAHFYIETAGGAVVHVDGTGDAPDIDLAGATVDNAWYLSVGDVLDPLFRANAFLGVVDIKQMGAGSVGTGTFRNSVDARVTSVAPTVTMTSGGVGTGAFRTSVDARVSAVAPTVTMTSGGVGTGAFRDSVRAGLNGDYTEAWTAYTPTFTAATTNPTLANFTRSGRYIQRGKQVTFTIVITCNAASGFGSGTYSFGLPVAARALNEVVVYGSQGAPTHAYVGRNNADTSTVILFGADFGANMNSTNSGMANGTVLSISGTYEAA